MKIQSKQQKNQILDAMKSQIKSLKDETNDFKLNQTEKTSFWLLQSA